MDPLATAALLAAMMAGAPGGQPAPIELGRRVVELFPTTDPYPPNTASSHRLTNAVQLVSVSTVGIADSGDSRFFLRLGGRFGVLRLRSREREDRAWQLGIEAGFSGQFDNDNGQDNIGWDGFYGLVLTRAQGPSLAWKLGVLHTSAHLGDELIERTGRARLGYTREELQAGLSLRFGPRLRGYLEGGYGYERRIDLQRPWRGQLGLVFEDRDRFAGGRFGWYVGADLSGWEERDWRLDAALQVGLLFPAGDGAWRLGIEAHDGRPPMAELFQDTETSVSMGLWLDL
ncbi:MAG TPA: DUF1207 domain-containing protein [Thermoanaerobaculia bacterium]|nr:DUF1207 domain-containing protein [Thermoanaerobaculia bacterium]